MVLHWVNEKKNITSHGHHTNTHRNKQTNKATKKTNKNTSQGKRKGNGRGRVTTNQCSQVCAAGLGISHAGLFSLCLLSLSLSLSLSLPGGIVMLPHTALSGMQRWSHEWSLQFKSAQPAHRLKWIFCIYSCNNDSISKYYFANTAWILLSH